MKFDFDRFLPQYEINTPRRRAAFMAQCHHESQGFTRVSENLNYGTQALIRCWPDRFNIKNAGVYAQAANVDKAVQQLQGAKLNALRQTVSSSKGDLTRLRIGPFDTRQQAEQAAAKAKQLRIDASVFQHPRG